MRSIETLARTYPDKTGKELFELQQKDKEFDEKQQEKRDRDKLKLIEDFNKNGAFFKGRFGSNQYHYRKFTNFVLVDGRVYCDVESMVAFDKEGDSMLRLNIEINFKDFQDYDRYLCHSTDKRITEEEYMGLREYYFDSFKKFW